MGKGGEKRGEIWKRGEILEKGGKNKKKGKKEEYKYKTMKGPLQCAPKTGPKMHSGQKKIWNSNNSFCNVYNSNQSIMSRVLCKSDCHEIDVKRKDLWIRGAY